MSVVYSQIRPLILVHFDMQADCLWFSISINHNSHFVIINKNLASVVSMIKYNIQLEQSLSFQSCQSNRFGYSADSYYYGILDPYHEDNLSLFCYQKTETNYNSQLQSRNDSLESCSTQSRQVSHKMEQEKRTAQKQCKKFDFYKNHRRRKSQRSRVENIYKAASKLCPKQESSSRYKAEKLTKNMLAFGKKPHFDFIISRKGEQFITQNLWIKNIWQKDGITLDDYNLLYTFKELKPVLQQFFRKKNLYRYLMTSRTTPKSRIIYLYHMEVFERNFLKGEFKSISETMMEIQKEKKYF